MYQTGAGVGTLVLGETVVAHSSLPEPAAQVARQMLPFTGIAVGVYLVVAMAMIVTGLVLRWTAARHEAK